MKRQKLFFVLVTLFMVLVICASFLFFSGQLHDHVNSDVERRLWESVEPNIVSFDLQMKEQIKKVNTLAAFLGKNWDLGKEVHTSLLQAAAENNGLLRCALAYPDGSFITHDGKNDGNVTADAFFQANMRGEFFITDPRPAVVDATKRVILFSAPIYDNSGKVIGSIIYSYLCDDMNQIFNLESMSGAMHMMVTKQGGEVLIDRTEGGAHTRSLEELRATCTHKNHPAEQCLSLTGDSGSYLLTFADDADTLYLRYDKIGFNDWYMVATISGSEAESGIAYAAQNQREQGILVGSVVLVYLVTLMVSWLMQRKLVDPETGALTIYAFKKKARWIFQNRPHDHFVVVKLDVKDFNLLKRIYSAAMGTKIIRCIAQALQSVLGDERAIFARLGLDAFVILLPYEGEDSLNGKREAFIDYFRILMHESSSAKIAFPTGQYVLQAKDFPRPDMDDILEKVDFAHQAAKQNSDIIIDYQEDIESEALFEKNVEDRMESAILDGEFTLYLQPKIWLKDEHLCGAEALVRWKIGDKYYMYPTDFIPVLEKNGFIVQLDKYMFDCTAQYIRQQLDSGHEPVPISVNFSRHHLNNEHFVQELCAIADRWDVPRKYLEIEITESAFLGRIDDIISFIERLHLEGFQISMDDFGNGYSCFAQLKDLKIDIIKIDKGFFSDSEDEARAEIVIAGIIKIAQELNITTVAEGIERKEQVDMLKALGCDVVQGYYYAKPVPANTLDIGSFSVQ